MDSKSTQFIDVILPLAIPNCYTYRVPENLNDNILIGQRVLVQFGRGQKQYSAIVNSIHNKAPENYQAKYILDILDDLPIVNEVQLKFWTWISHYYMCDLGEVMNAALPGGLRLSSESRVVLHPKYQEVIDELSDDEYLVIEALEVRNILSFKEISELLNVKYVHGKVKSLIEKSAIMVEEELKEKFKPKMEDYIDLQNKKISEEQLQSIFNELERAPKQLDLLMSFIHLSDFFSKNKKSVRKKDLLQSVNASPSILQQLIKKEVFEILKVEVGRLGKKKAINKKNKLNTYQVEALDSIHNEFQEKEVVLLHGVTSSGKTEIYIHLIEEAVKKGKQVLYLLPEIALTTQIIQRLSAIFGNKVGVYHSRFNENERVEVWKNVLEFDPEKANDFSVILGARSSMFLPFKELGLIIIDEEHESSFKQYDPAPRYQARDSAIVLAAIHKCNVLLGSATPSIESMYNAKQGKYALVELKKRHRDIQMPNVLVADVKEATKRKKMKSHFSPLLLEKMEENLEKGKQVILFQNRRGYSPFLLCEVCGNSPQCINCDVSLTYHKYKHELNCHYCGYHIRIPSQCPACGSGALKVKGFGTEKIEEELAIYFPGKKISRMDWDTTRGKKSYYNIITAFENKEIDVLVGTQMITKGLDFDHVGLVGIMNADQMLRFPDFRAYERSFQLMTQVAGRAGRKNDRGEVVIQTNQVDHPTIRQVVDSKYEEMYKNELVDRRNFLYPPFVRIIQINLRHKDRNILQEAALSFEKSLKQIFGVRLLGPEEPGIPRIRNYYHQNLMLKLKQEDSLKRSKELLRTTIIDFNNQKAYKSVRVVLDVDPN